MRTYDDVKVMLLTDLYSGVKEGDIVQQWFPLRHVGNVQLVLCYNAVRALEAGFHTLRRFCCKLD